MPEHPNHPYFLSWILESETQSATDVVVEPHLLVPCYLLLFVTESTSSGARPAMHRVRVTVASSTDLAGR